ncbi:hypothetical protein CRM22_005514 [Opisthorchis felineus]|uniref:Uncharacterized protein n=1 Tax=Opisthorchis felineus TaxID=147828 RepID=A0A4S2LQS1_OPIFE|nr:hypothetical protein CRM22_005514 [Opisthorchis felineus]
MDHSKAMLAMILVDRAAGSEEERILLTISADCQIFIGDQPTRRLSESMLKITMMLLMMMMMTMMMTMMMMGIITLPFSE